MAHENFIGGAWKAAASGATDDVVDPATGHVITQVPRSSDHYLGGVVSYSDAVKHELLDVPGAHIDDVGAVSAEVAEAVADAGPTIGPVQPAGWR